LHVNLTTDDRQLTAPDYLCEGYKILCLHSATRQKIRMVTKLRANLRKDKAEKGFHRSSLSGLSSAVGGQIMRVKPIRSLRLLRRRETEPELAALSRRADDAYCAAKFLDDAAHDGESQAVTGGARFMEPGELREQLRLLVRG